MPTTCLPSYASVIVGLPCLVETDALHLPASARSGGPLLHRISAQRRPQGVAAGLVACPVFGVLVGLDDHVAAGLAGRRRGSRQQPLGSYQVAVGAAEDVQPVDPRQVLADVAPDRADALAGVQVGGRELFVMVASAPDDVGPGGQTVSEAQQPLLPGKAFNLGWGDPATDGIAPQPLIT
jgi:hypothetical protein